MTATLPAPTLAAPTSRIEAVRQVGTRLRRPSRAIPTRILLAIIAAVQVALAWRPGLQTTAFQDEGLYIFMGHRMLDHLTNGVQVSEHPGAYFSGAPGFYPVLAAVGDHVAGLQGARTVSLLFAIAAMVAVYGLTTELFGRLAGLFGAAAFAVNGSVIFQSHLATYDSMMLALMSTAAWLAVRSARRDALLWAPAVGALLTAAVFAKYAALVYVLVVAALAAAAGWHRYRWLVVRRAVFVMLSTAAMTYFVLELFAHDLIRGMIATTTDRQALAPASTSDLVHSVWHWTSLWYVLALGGAAVLLWQRRIPVAVVLLIGSVIGVAGQIRIHEATSLAKHVAFGITFLAPLIGYLLATASKRIRPLAAVAVLLVLVLASAGIGSSHQFLTGWVSDSDLRVPLRNAIALNPDKAILGEEPSAQRYELRQVVRPTQWNDTFGLKYDGVSGDAAYVAAINQTHFGVIYLSMTTPHGRFVQHYLATNRTPYRLATKVPRYLRGRNVGDWLIYVPRAS